MDTWQARFLLLPTGQVLFSTQQSSLAILTVDPATGAPDTTWKPTITSAPSTIVAGHTYVLSGTQLNGLSQAVSYGDDAPAATNYPIARLTKTGGNAVQYLRTFDFSTLGVATGTAVHSTSVQVSDKIPPGQYRLEVIANGIPSDPIDVHVAAQDSFFIVDRSTFAQGEVQALIDLQGAPAVFDPALYVVVEGFKPAELGLTHANLGSPSHKPVIADPTTNVSVEFSGAVIPEDPTLPARPQRFTFPYRVAFQDATSMFGFANSPETLTLQSTLTVAGTTVSSAADIQLIKNPNPYILHGDTAHGNEWYLSVDIRVFQIKAGQTRFGVHMGSSGSRRSVATSFIQQAITNLNGSPGSAGALFDALPSAEDAASLALAPNDVNGVPVYNFALARVRLRDITQADDVRLFFRMWPAQQTSAAYDPQTLYRTGTNADGQKVALLGVRGPEIVTIPFFATPRVDTSTASMSSQTDTPNIHTIQPDPIGGEVRAYYGCWLDINQPDDLLFPARLVGPDPTHLPDGPYRGMGPLLSIQQHVRSAHQCLLAEISFDPDQIPSNADPSISDKLAQRNLAFVNVPNPGLLDSRRAPQTFELRPTPAALPRDCQPDDLMSDWGDLPAGTEAEIYIPAADVDEIVKLAGEMYTTHRLRTTEAHTLRFPVGGVTYIPVPRGQGGSLPGLLTVDLPHTVRKGQTHTVSVRQVTSAAGVVRRPVRPEDTSPPRRSSRAPAAAETGGPASHEGARFEGLLRWRRVLGSFRLTIPVETKQELLAPEERLLSVLRWIEHAIPAGDRWHLVFRRYVDQTARRVSDMGGNPDLVKAHPDGRWHKVAEGPEDRDRDEREDRREGEKLVSITGKVVGIVYDRFGDFVGFRLDTEDGERHFHSREHDVHALVERAWRERILLTVLAERHDPNRPMTLVLRGAVAPFEA